MQRLKYIISLIAVLIIGFLPASAQLSNGGDEKGKKLVKKEECSYEQNWQAYKAELKKINSGEIQNPDNKKMEEWFNSLIDQMDEEFHSVSPKVKKTPKTTPKPYSLTQTKP